MRRINFSLNIIPLLLTSQLFAAEGGVSQYLLGSQDLLAGFLQPPGTYVRNLTFNYKAKSAQGGPVVLNGFVGVDVHLDNYVDLLKLTHVTKHRFFGAFYAFSLTSGLGKSHLSIQFDPFQYTITGKARGLTDTTLVPIILGWHHTRQLHTMFSQSFFLPTGKYNVNDAANIGKNRYAADSSYGVTWFSHLRKHEISAVLGYGIIRKNFETQYLSGNEAHLEVTLAKHLKKQHLAIGATGYAYRQITGDRGDTRLGANIGQIFAIGPIASMDFKLGADGLKIMTKYLHEFGGLKHMQGNSIWLSMTYGVKSS